MSKYQNVLSKHEKLPSEDGMLTSIDETSLWLKNVDIATYDLPHIRSLLSNSYADWQKLTCTTPVAKYLKSAIFQYDGTFIAGDNIISHYIEDKGSHLFEQCIQSRASVVAIIEREAETDERPSTIYLYPMLTREYNKVYAIMACVVSEDSVNTKVENTNDAISLLPIVFDSCFYKNFEYIFIEDMMQEQKKINFEANRRSLLYKLVQRIQNQVDIDMLLTELLDGVATLCPGSTQQLLMTQDQHKENPRVSHLVFNEMMDDISIRTFMDGKLTINDITMDNGEHKQEIGFPLGGKQGVYGVLHLIMHKGSISESDLQYISTLVDTAGFLFENAKLFEQSNLLIRELRLINELTQRVNQSLKLTDIYLYSTQELLNIFKADYCCILQVSKELDGLEVVSSNLRSMNKKVFQKDYGFGGLVYSKGETIILSDYIEKMDVSSIFMEDSKSKSLIAAPLVVNGEITGAILISHQNAHFFTYNDYKLLQALSNHIGISVSNALLHSEVKRMANRDMLTNLYARHYLNDVIKKKQKTDYCGSLIVVDIDDFKLVNDTYGHQKGDNVIKKVSEIIKSTIRVGDLAARWGGEELVIYLPHLGLEKALIMAERIRKQVELETEPTVTVSCGISEWDCTDDQVSVDSLFHAADMALYRAKNGGRNQTQVEIREN
ncbi:sensor domain-containing diguanylate cyclase [Paenibacillus sp. CMAA1364]